jgi:hypothetical protein
MRLVKFMRAFLGDNITPTEPVECYFNAAAVCTVEPALGFDGRTAEGTRISTLSGSWVVQEPLASVVAALQGVAAPVNITQGVVSGPGTVGVHIGARR